MFFKNQRRGKVAQRWAHSTGRIGKIFTNPPPKASRANRGTTGELWGNLHHRKSYLFQKNAMRITAGRIASLLTKRIFTVIGAGFPRVKKRKKEIILITPKLKKERNGQKKKWTHATIAHRSRSEQYISSGLFQCVTN